MSENYCVPLSRLVEEFHLEVVFEATDYKSVQLTVEEVARPGLQLAGYFDHFEPMRLQVMGNAEVSYLEKMTQQEQMSAFDRLFSYKFPALLLARGFQPGQACLEMAKKHDVENYLV